MKKIIKIPKQAMHCKICGCKNAQEETLLDGRRVAICNNCRWYLKGFLEGEKEQGYINIPNNAENGFKTKI